MDDTARPMLGDHRRRGEAGGSVRHGSATGAMSPCRAEGASFDRLRMRKIENGMCQMPRRKDLMPSLSKDATPPRSHKRLSRPSGAERVGLRWADAASRMLES